MAKKPKISQIQMAQVLERMSKSPFGIYRGGARPPINLDVQGLKNKKQPLFIKKDAAQMTQEQYDKIAKGVAKQKGISVGKAKALLWKELSQAPKFKPPIRPVVSLASKIPLRQDMESTGLRAVKYKGEIIYLTPGQIKGVAKNLGVKVERITNFIDVKGGAVASAIPSETYLTKSEQQTMLNEKMKNAQEKAIEERYRSEAEKRITSDVVEEREANRLRREAMRDWENQARAAGVNPRVRHPLEGLGKASPASKKAEEYAQRLYEKTFKELSKSERNKINEIIRIERNLVLKAEASVVGRNMDKLEIERNQYKGPKPGGGGMLGGILGQGFGGGIIDPMK